MKVLLLSRPIHNAGDFLFSEKAEEAFARIVPEADVVTDHISKVYDMHSVKSYDVVVAAGGPLYDDAFLTKEAFPLLRLMPYVSDKLYFLSCGCYGFDTTSGGISNHIFNDEVINSLQKLDNSKVRFSCRDSLSEQILNSNGINNTIMSGCTAWYDYEYIDCIKTRYNGKIEKILISDQGVTKDSSRWDDKYASLVETIDMLRGKYFGAEFMFTFNGGINTKYSGEYNRRVCKMLIDRGIQYKDISGSSRGFKMCDDYDLHVGFRVHTHIFCLSRRIPSMLIGEDIRGISLNQTLGMPDIRDYEYEWGKISRNNNLTRELDYYIDYYTKHGFEFYSMVFDKMRMTYYQSFVPYIEEICNK